MSLPISTDQHDLEKEATKRRRNEESDHSEEDIGERKHRRGMAMDSPDEMSEDEDSISGGSGSLQEEPTRGRRTLWFPQSCTMGYMEKLLWAVQLGRQHPSFLPLIKEGQARAYLTVVTSEAVAFLTVDGFKGTVMLIPEEREKLTKVIVFRYPVILDPEFLLDNEKIVWAKRHTVRGEKRNQAIALVRGEMPDRIYINGAGYRRVAPYVDEPILCLKCSRWGHKAWKCQADPRCRFCGKSHDSRLCRKKIEAKERVQPRCCNCNGEHNAGSLACPMRPRRQVDKQFPSTRDRHGGQAERITASAVTTENKWMDAGRLQKRLSYEKDLQGSSPGHGSSVVSPRQAGAEPTLREELQEITRFLRELSTKVDHMERKIERLTKQYDVCESGSDVLNEKKNVGKVKSDNCEALTVSEIRPRVIHSPDVARSGPSFHLGTVKEGTDLLRRVIEMAKHKQTLRGDSGIL